MGQDYAGRWVRKKRLLVASCWLLGSRVASNQQPATNNQQQATNNRQPALQSPPMRAGWNEYFMGIAHQAATRSTCARKHVGAVIVRDRTVLSTGYNGSLRGLPHCEDVGCVVEDGHCVTTVHAEANAILQAARNGVSIAGAELYTTASPCWNCFKLIANAGISRIFYGEFYRDERSREVAQQIGIDLVDLGMPAAAGTV
jgi:dCMP deaminase